MSCLILLLAAVLGEQYFVDTGKASAVHKVAVISVGGGRGTVNRLESRLTVTLQANGLMVVPLAETKAYARKHLPDSAPNSQLAASDNTVLVPEGVRQSYPEPFRKALGDAARQLGADAVVVVSANGSSLYLAVVDRNGSYVFAIIGLATDKGISKALEHYPR
jgi:hypothetical protein